MNKKSITLVVFFFLAFFAEKTIAQTDSTYNYEQNPLTEQNPFGLPQIYKYDVEYDPVTKGFVIKKELGDVPIGRPYIMDFDSYMKYQNNSFLRKNWTQYNKNTTGDNDFLNDYLNPQLNLSLPGFGKIFGSDELTVKPHGNLNINLGISYYHTENPSMAKRDRTNVVPEFTQDIQIGINGKVGTKFNVGINYNTKSMFDFEDRKKIQYAGEEDEIIQKIEAGNVTFPIDNTLIQGSSTLWGIRTDLKFGRLTVSTILSQQKGQSKTIEVQSGAVLNDYEISAADYDADKHFFLNHYFRDHYEEALANLPLIASNIKITRVEVWVTNKTNQFDNARNIVAFMDLGEDQKDIYAQGFVYADPNQTFPSNTKNNLYEMLTTTYSGIRDIANVSSILSSTPLTDGDDYVKLESARKVDPSQYTVNTDLGYISLKFQLRPGECLAVAYEYTVNGEVYQVGEFSNDVEAPNTLILKMLRGPASTPNNPNWDLMMKNIYALGTYDVKPDDFTMEIYYNNDVVGTKINYIPEGDIAKKRLLSVMNFDRSDNQGNPNPDGFFDFNDGVTIDAKNGLIIFPELEPFGSFLQKKIGNDNIARKYVYNELYDSTQYIAKQAAVKNKFFLKGSYRSSSGSEIMLNVMNLPQGGVKVTQGGVELQENVDYSVDYNIGKVTILNEALLQSGMPIKINVESNDQYGLITKNLVGTNLNYQFSENFNIAATALRLSEIPLDPKTRFGEEPISNTMWGMNTNYTREVPFLTKMVDFLPFIETKVPSKVTLSAEFAQFVPGTPRVLRRFTREKGGVSFIDDFEDSQTYIDLKSPMSWVLASVPQGQPDLFPEASDATTLLSGFNRARLAWYDISNDFVDPYSRIRPAYLTDDDLSDHRVRQIYEKEIFPNRQNPTNQPLRLTVLNLAFYPDERGPYNFDVDGVPGISEGIDENGKLNDPQSRWGGIMRSLYVTDFESSNIGFIEFWLMDPFVYDSTSTGGDVYIDLGDISEDILRDGRKSVENAIPYPEDPNKVDTTQWGIVSKVQATTRTFDNNVAARKLQDVGYDGLSDTKEQKFYLNYLQTIAQKYGLNSKAYIQAATDPSNDDFRYYMSAYYDSIKAGILERYKEFNGVEGNSPINTGNNNVDLQSITNFPDMEDVNADNTLDNYEAYYQYHIHLSPDQMNVGENYIVNKVETKALGLPNNKDENITWYQFKIPIHNPDKVVGNIQGFKSIRFIRMFLRNFDDTTILRFAKFDLVKEQWREYENEITEGGEGSIFPQPSSDGALDISVVNIEESTQKQPVNYVMPPGVARNQSFYGEQVYLENEQAMSLKVLDLPDGHAKAVYKTVEMDMRKFDKLKMYVHEEALINQENQLQDNDLTLFVRLGSDFTENYYEYEIPLKKTPAGQYNTDENDIYNPDRYVVWPTENALDLDLTKLINAKQQRNVDMAAPNSNISYNTPYIVMDGKNKITIIGNPNLANVKAIMIGIRNPRKETNPNPDDGLPKSAEIWVNELRLTGFNTHGGWASDVRLSANLADFGNVTFSGYMHTPGFGSIEQRVNERYNDQALEYDFTTQLQLGKFFPKDYGVSIPLFLGFSQNISNPEYNPFDPDIKFSMALSNPNLTDEAKTTLKNAAQTFSIRRSINITNINVRGKTSSNKKSGRNGNNKKRKTKSGKRNKLVAPWKISNFSTSFAYNEVYSRTPIIEYNIQKDLMFGFNYNYSPNSKPFEPFKKVKLFRKKAFQLIRDFNFYYLPSRVNFTSEVDRQYITFKNRVVVDADINLPASYQKNFLWNRTFDFTYKLTKSLKIDFNSTNQARVEPDGWRETGTVFQNWGWDYQTDSIFMNIFDLGRNTDYTQRIRVNYRVPINKLPLLRWTNLTAAYSANYNWRRGIDPLPVPATDSTPAHTFNFGNTIQNSSTVRFDLRLNFSSLYRSVKYLKEVDSRFTKKGRQPVKREDKTVTFNKKIRVRKGRPINVVHNLKTENITDVTAKTADSTELKVSYEVVSPNKIKVTADTTLSNVTITVTGKRKRPENPLIVISDYMLKSMMMLQNANISYKINGGSLLNGYLPETQYFGLQKQGNQWAPGYDFWAGLQDRLILDKFSSYGWITQDTMFNMPMNFTQGQEARVQVNLEPLNNVRVSLNFQRTMTLRETQYGYNSDGRFLVNTKMINGNFFLSFNTIKTAFEPIDDSTHYSANFEKFLQMRSDIAYEYARKREAIDPNYTLTTYVDSSGNVVPVGYSLTSQNVLLTAFLSTYSGFSPDKFGYTMFPLLPLPDWRITFDGLSNIPFIKNYVKKFTVMHSYSSTYSINNFASNPSFEFEKFEKFGYSDALYASNGTFIPQYEISGVILSEKFVPFIGVDINWTGTLTTRIEYKRARDLFLSFSNNQIRERHNNTFTVGAGYTIKDLAMNIKVGGKTQNLKSDLNFRLDLSVGRDIEIFRKITENISTLNTSRNTFTLTFTSDYAINQNLSIQFYYNHNFMETNATFPTTNAQGGFKIRYTFTQ